jgi:uncharacterized membrane protein
MKNITDVKKELESLKYETDLIQDDVERIKDKLIDHTPEHFSRQDFIRAFIGALFLGFSVLFSGNIMIISTNVPVAHLYIIILCTVVLLTLEIYIIGYSKVVNKIARKFGQFWIKRLIAFYVIALIVAAGLAFIFGFQYLMPGQGQFIRLVIVLSAPCAVGASLGDLLKKY